MIGRWTSVDPEGQHWSPYLGMGNDPVNGMDPNGGWGKYFNEKGVEVGDDGIADDKVYSTTDEIIAQNTVDGQVNWDNVRSSATFEGFESAMKVDSRESCV